MHSTWRCNNTGDVRFSKAFSQLLQDQIPGLPLMAQIQRGHIGRATWYDWQQGHWASGCVANK